MRIVGGIYKGRVLATFDGTKIRPTPDMVRESLFNILRTRIENTRFLDLFSGTGAMGIEALSRGAREVVLNDLSRESVALIKANVEKLKIESGVKITNYDYAVALDRLGQFDIIYIDAPYGSNLGEKALLIAQKALTKDGIIVFEEEYALDGEFNGLVKYDKRKYGRVHLAFFKREGDAL